MNTYQEVCKIFGVKEYPQRTQLQNKALHLFFTLQAKAFNEAGYDMKAILDAIRCGIPWTAEGLKEGLWRPIQIQMLNKTSTTELDTTEITRIWDALNLALSTRLNVGLVPFPSEDQTLAYIESLKKSLL